MTFPRWPLVALFALVLPALALDQNGNQQSDVWEMIFKTGSLPPNGDADGDGWSNAVESAAGTNPLDPNSFPGLQIAPNGAGSLLVSWMGLAGKKYSIETRADMTQGAWGPATADIVGAGGPAQMAFSIGGAPRGFFRLNISDQDTDGDGLSDWEELAIGFNPTSTRTDRNDLTDAQRVPPGLTAANTITVSVYDAICSERWPAPGVIVLRRGGGLQPLTVNISLGGTATRGVDYSVPFAGDTVSFAPGQREAFVVITPLADSDDAEPTETITLMATGGTGYTVGSPNSATVSLLNETNTSGPSAKAAARFLLQAAFGPDQDTDGNDIPQNVESLMATGFSGWIDVQFARPIGYIQPWVDWAAVNAQNLGLYGNWKEFSWWSRAMGAPRLRPDDTNDPVLNPVPPDPLRQRVAFALSEILVASDRPEALAVEQLGMANFYDLFETHAFGNYGNLLQAVALHPVMGIYLSHLGNKKANPATHVYPDENFAREIMQLFSIGLWMLNPDGTRQLDGQGQPIATYNNGDITELARVFTGLSFDNNTDFQAYPRAFTVPMKGFDAYHDLGAKTLLGGLQLPARAASGGTATMADVTAAVDNLFHHPNVGPFLALRLIQRLVTSNPTPAYVGRVAAAFANNGSGVRGDMQAVVKAILLDAEARDPAMMSQPTWGKLREPFLRCVNFATAFNAKSTSGYYPLDQFALAHLEDPMNSPSVFNFFLPTHSPSGALAQAGLVAPEFQIINAASGVSGANYFWQHVLSDLHYYGTANASYAVRLNLDPELTFLVPAANVNDDVPPPRPTIDHDALLRRLDLALTGGTLPPQQFQIIREAMLRIGTSTWQWHRERLRMAIYLITTSADFNVLR